MGAGNAYTPMRAGFVGDAYTPANETANLVSLNMAVPIRSVQICMTIQRHSIAVMFLFIISIKFDQSGSKNKLPFSLFLFYFLLITIHWENVSLPNLQQVDVRKDIQSPKTHYRAHGCEDGDWSTKVLVKLTLAQCHRRLVVYPGANVLPLLSMNESWRFQNKWWRCLIPSELNAGIVMFWRKEMSTDTWPNWWLGYRKRTAVTRQICIHCSVQQQVREIQTINI